MTKLLLDQNLSMRLPNMLRDLYPEMTHVSALGLARSSDAEIWQYARDFNYLIITQDADFDELGLLLGFPPKIIWIRHGNCTTNEIAALLRKHTVNLLAFIGQPDERILVLR